MQGTRHSIFLILCLGSFGCFTRSENAFSIVSGNGQDPCYLVPNASNCTEQPEEPELDQGQDDPDNPYGEENTEVDPLGDDTGCDEEMRVRKIIPDLDTTAPVNTKPVVLTIGNGDETHIDIELRDDQFQLVEAEQEVSCYLHETDTEVHCTYLLTPTEDLKPETDYTVVAMGTENHQDPNMQYRSWFTTTTERATLSNGTPTTEILGYLDREPTAVEFCDWKDAKKYELKTTVTDEQEDNLSIIQVFEVHDQSTGDEELVHSIIMLQNYPTVWYRQIMRPGTEGPRCYRSYHRDIAGNESPSSDVVCWEE